MSKAANLKVLVTVTLELSTRPETLAKWLEDPRGFEGYALGACFRNHTRKVVSATVETDGDRQTPRSWWKVPASGHSDDWVYDIEFDATRWFEQASDDELRALHGKAFCNAEAADVVLLFFENTGADVRQLLEYCRRTQANGADGVGFECIVDREAAMAWIAARRPALHATLVGSEAA